MHITIPREVKDAFDRAIRTFFQAFFGILAAQAIAIGASFANGEIDFTLWKRLLITAFGAGVVSVITFFHNYFEDHGLIPTMFKPTDRALGDKILGEEPQH